MHADNTGEVGFHSPNGQSSITTLPPWRVVISEQLAIGRHTCA